MSDMTAQHSVPSSAQTAAHATYPWWATLIKGIALLVVGALLIMQTLPTTIILIQFVAWFWLIAGVFDIVSLFWNRAQWGWKLFSGILGIVVGAYIIAAPFIGAAVLLGAYALLLGIAGIIYGIADLIKAFQGGGWGIGILGAFSLIFGFIIAFNLAPAAIALPWVFGVFAVVFGIAAIITSFMMRGAAA